MRTWATAAVVFVVFSVVAGAQSNQPPQNAAFPSAANTQNTIKVNVNVVNVLATVTDKKGHIVLDLGQKDFRLFEDNQPQTIQYFSRETDLPLRIGILIDTSNSVRERLHFEQEAAIDFLSSTIRPGKDMAFVVGFDVEPQMVQDYTDDEEKLADAVHKLAAGGGTAMYDTIYFACKEKMIYFPPPEPYLRRVLIVISDGLDNQSEHTRDEALAMAQHAEVTIYSISTNRGTNEGVSDTTRGDKVLAMFAQETGGRVFHPFAATDLAENFQEIARELRSQYSLGYVSSNPTHDGSFRKIAIEARNKDLHVHAKTGYWAATQ